MKQRYFIVVFISLLFIFSACQLAEETDSNRETPLQGPEKRFSLGGAPIDVVVGLSAETLALTDLLTVTIQVEYEEGIQIQPPYLSEENYAPLLLVQSPRENISWSQSKNRIIKTWTYKLEPMSSGDFSLRPFRVFFRLISEKGNDNSQWPVYKIETEEMGFHVTAVDPDSQDDIRDIKDLILPDYNVLPPLLTGVSIGILLLVWWLVFRIRNRAQPSDATANIVIDYLKESLEKLDELEKKDYISQREYERLHVELSIIMRYFIENRFGLRALEQTTEEFMRAIRYAPDFSNEQQAMLQQLMELADLVKFATYDPGSNASREAVKTVRTFIESTRQKDED